MTEENVVTAPADAPKDTIEFETTNPPPEAGSENEVVAEPNKAPTKEGADAEPKKPINPRTLQRKQEKERLYRENAELKVRNEMLEKAGSPPKQADKEFDPSIKPDITKYTDALEYADDLSKHNTYIALKERDDETAAVKKNERIEAFEERADSLRTEKPDFDDKLTQIRASNLITPKLEEVIMASPMSADLIYHLGNYGADLMTLRGLPENMLPKAVKQLEAFIKTGAPAQTPPATPATRQTQAKPPITPVKGNAVHTKAVGELTQEELENMPQHEFEAKYMKN